MNPPILYGVGYEPLGSLADFIDPFGIRKIPGEIKSKVDHYIDSKADHAASVAEKRVEQGVRKAIDDSGRSALAFVAGGLLAGAIAGGIYMYRRSHAEHDE
jgi:hypothetical protein